MTPPENGITAFRNAGIPAIVLLSAACASTMIFLIPRHDVVVSEELIEQAEEGESGML